MVNNNLNKACIDTTIVTHMVNNNPNNACMVLLGLLTWLTLILTKHALILLLLLKGLTIKSDHVFFLTEAIDEIYSAPS